MNDGSIDSAAGSDVVAVAHTAAAAPNPNAVEHRQATNQGPPGKRRTVNRIVRGWTISDDDDSTVREADPPVEPTTAPPPLLSTRTIRLQAYGSNDTPRTKWGCDQSMDGYDNERFWDNYFKLVSYDTKHTYRVEIQALKRTNTSDTKIRGAHESKIHRRIMLVSLVSYHFKSKHEQGRCITMTNGDGEPSEDFLNDVYCSIVSSKVFTDVLYSVENEGSKNKNDPPPPPPPVTLIIQSEIAPPVPNRFELSRTSSDDIRPILQSKTFHDRVSSWCQELNINAKYYTPVFENKSSKEQPPTKNTPNVVQKSAMEWWKKPQYSIDYCFESIIQEIIQEENTTGDAAVVSDSTTVATPSTTTVERSTVKGQQVKSPSKRRKIAPIAAVARNSSTNRNKRMRH